MKALVLIATATSLGCAGEWTIHEGVSIPVPPSAHPRLYLQSSDIPDLQRRTKHPVLKRVWDQMQETAKTDAASALEVNAIKYLLTRDKNLGQQTVAGALRLMKESSFNPKGQDVTRPIGRLLVTGAVVYDWCYPVISAEQKKTFVQEFLRYAHLLEYGYPPPKGNTVVGHYAEWMLMRDLLSAGIAIYNEFPEMYQVAANRFFGAFLPVRNWWYPGHAFHQGTSYSETRFSSDLYPLWIFHRMGFPSVYHPSQQFVPYSWIYMRRPDGQLLRSGDGQSRPPKLRSLLVASYYKDPYILADYLRDPGIDHRSQVFEFLWRDPDLTPRPIAELPLSRYMGAPYGWMVARSGWDENSVIAEMKVNINHFGNHQHWDAGAFQIYHKGPLAIDSGVYEGVEGGYDSQHDVNYNKRTIAHNSLLIYDPNEQFIWRGRSVRHNDGGQKFPNGGRGPSSIEQLIANHTGDVLGQGFGPDPVRPAYTYMKGDITAAYGDKVKQVQRSFVFLNLPTQPVPAALAVFDRVVSSRPEFKKYWLLHSMEEPRIAGSVITVALEQRGWTGKLIDQVLLPARAEITSVGGPGKEFWVFGKNFPNRPRPTHDPTPYEIGEWRVEVSPAQPASTDVFLNVMQTMDSTTNPLPVTRISEKDREGFFLADTSVLFQRDGSRTNLPVTFRSAGRRFLVTDLAEGTWQVWREGAIAAPAVRVMAEEGTLWFEGEPGWYTLRR